MKAFWRRLARSFLAAAATGAAVTTTSGDAITSGNVLIPSIVAGAVVALHSVLQMNHEPPDEPPADITHPPR